MIFSFFYQTREICILYNLTIFLVSFYFINRQLSLIVFNIGYLNKLFICWICQSGLTRALKVFNFHRMT